MLTRRQKNLNIDLVTAIKKSSKNKVKRLLDKKADVNNPIFYAESPLHIAVSQSNQNSDLIALLIESGADVNHINSVTGATPLTTALYHAMRTNSLSIINLLINYGATIPNLDKFYELIIRYILMPHCSSPNYLIELVSAFYTLLTISNDQPTPFHYESKVRQHMKNLSTEVNAYKSQIHDRINEAAKPAYIPHVVTNIIGEYLGLFAPPKIIPTDSFKLESQTLGY